MTRAEENVKNLEGILEAAASLNEQDQAVVTKIMELLATSTSSEDKKESDKATKILVGMMAFDFLRKFVAEHLSPEKGMDIIMKELFKMKG